MFSDFRQSDSNHFDKLPQRVDASQTPLHPATTSKAEGLHLKLRTPERLGQPDADRVRLRVLVELETERSGPQQRDDHREAALSASNSRPGVANLDGASRSIEEVILHQNKFWLMIMGNQRSQNVL